jgi:autotransporter-associated beta strand protein
MKNSAAFGTASGTTTVASGATVQIEGADFLIPEPITVSGIGVQVNSVYQGAIKNIRNKNTWSGAITLGLSSTIVSGTLSGTTTDSLALTGNIATGGYTLTADVVKGMRMDGVISGAGGINKISGDTLILGGANTYTGATTLSNGIIQLQNQDGLGSSALGNTLLPGTGASNTTVASGTAIKIVGSGFLIPEVLVLSGTGVASRGSVYNKANKIN